MKSVLILMSLLILATTAAAGDLPRQHDPDPREVHLGPVRMLTDGAENAEAYWSRDGKQLVLQSNREPYGCDQIYTLDPVTAAMTLVSTGLGRTTCAYFAGTDDQYVVYASTHLAQQECPPTPDMSRGYVWPLYEGYDVFRLDMRNDELVPLTTEKGYDAEATVSPDGQSIVFTSVRSGDLEVFTMDLDGGNVKQLTDAPGYDGGPFFSPDGTKIVYRASRPQGEQLADYQALLAQGLVRPGRLEIYVMNTDGSDQRQITDLGCGSFAPFFHPSGEKILFSTNHPDPRGREFDIWMINLDGSGLERVTYAEGFDGFPMFSPDGQQLVFGSNRHNSQPGETNIFVTEWRD